MRNRKLKILMVSPVVGDAFGQEKVMRLSVEMLRADGHQVYFLGDCVGGSIPDNEGIYIFPGLSSIRVFSQSAHARDCISSVMKQVEFLQPDVVHLLDQFDSRLQSQLCEKFPTVITSHLLSTTCPSSTRLNGEAEGCRVPSGLGCLRQHKKTGCLSTFQGDLNRAIAVGSYLVRKKSLRKIDRVIAVSRYVKNTLILDGWAPNQVTSVPNPVEISGQVRAASPVPEPLVVSVARLEPYKGIDVVLKALSLMREVAWTFWIVGEGREKEPLHRLAQALGISSRVKFLGRCDYPSALSLMKAATLLVQANVGPEAFGLSVAEASAMGVPVVVSDIPALNEIVVHEESGMLATPNNEFALSQAMRRVLGDETLRNKFKIAGPRRMKEHFSLERHLRETLRVYHEVLKEADPVFAPQSLVSENPIG